MRRRFGICHSTSGSIFGTLLFVPDEGLAQTPSLHLLYRPIFATYLVTQESNRADKENLIPPENSRYICEPWNTEEEIQSTVTILWGPADSFLDWVLASKRSLRALLTQGNTEQIACLTAHSSPLAPSTAGVRVRNSKVENVVRPALDSSGSNFLFLT